MRSTKERSFLPWHEIAMFKTGNICIFLSWKNSLPVNTSPCGVCTVLFWHLTISVLSFIFQFNYWWTMSGIRWSVIRSFVVYKRSSRSSRTFILGRVPLRWACMLNDSEYVVRKSHLTVLHNNREHLSFVVVECLLSLCPDKQNTKFCIMMLG